VLRAIGRCLQRPMARFFRKKAGCTFGGISRRKELTGSILLHFRHFAVLSRLSAAYGTLANFILQYRIVTGTGTPEFVAGYDMPEVDETKGNEEYAENQSEDV
jgi:hypothetical protein